MEFCLTFTCGKISTIKDEHFSPEILGRNIACAHLSKITFKYPFQDIAWKAQAPSVILLLSKRSWAKKFPALWTPTGSFLESRYWHRKYSAGSEGFDVSAVPTSQSEAHIQSAGHIQLLTHTPLTVSNLLMWVPWCSTEKIVTGARNYPLKKQAVWKGIWSLPQTNRPALSVRHTFDINRGI